ncbi:MAG: anion permease [Sulfurovum sp.]|nr:anion permease [Sulfurovum sp.]
MSNNITNEGSTESYKIIGIDLIRLSFAVFFMFLVAIYIFINFQGTHNYIFLLIATLFASYMAMNIGANDVANNIGPTIGSNAITLGMGLLLAATFEVAGAFIAGGDVVNTIKKDIIDISSFDGNTNAYIWVMTSALLGAGLWLNFATYFKAPVSTTHSIIGGIMGAGIAAIGFHVVSWGTMWMIAASWIISPLIGGVIAASFLLAIKKTIIFKEDKLKAATRWVPIFVSIMVWAFVTYLVLKGFHHIWHSITSVLSFLPQEKKPSLFIASSFGMCIALIFYMVMRVDIRRKIQSIDNTRHGINTLFNIPLIFAAALLSFAHGANDLANAIGPLTAIHDAILHTTMSSEVKVSLWIIVIGTLSISIGILLYGSRLVRTIGFEITKLDQVRAFSVAVATSITVIIASQFALPVSSTQIVLGAIFGIGFLREFLDFHNPKQKVEYEESLLQHEKKLISALKSELSIMEEKKDKQKVDHQRIISIYEALEEEEKRILEDKKRFKYKTKVQYINRGDIKRIIFAWIITIPIAGCLSALIFFIIRGVML